MSGIGRALVEVAIGMFVVGVGLYINRFVSRWSWGNAENVMRIVDRMARFGIRLVLLSVPVMAVGVVLYNR
jgi:biopolymer transport protein ExbB/TolQ